MFKEKLTPRFNDTDALGHINNATYLSWFEYARNDLFKIFNPELDVKKWNLILARIEIDYLAQGDFNKDVELEMYFDKLGRSSMSIIQTAKQGGIEVAKAKTVMVYFDYEENKSKEIPPHIRSTLSEHLI